MSRAFALLLAIMLGCAMPGAAHAHLMPNSVISLDFGRRTIEAEILMPASELAYATGHPLAVSPARGAGAEKPFIDAYIQRHLVAATSDGRRWTAEIVDIAIIADSWNTDIQATIRLTPPADASPRRLMLGWDGIIDRVANHFVLVFARSDFATGTLASTPELIGGLQGGTRTLRIDRGAGSAWRGFGAALGLGMAHIAEGHDHLLFLIALILPAPLLAAGGRWTRFAGWRHTLHSLAWIVSAFTIGHSITLIGGAFFGWRLPSKPVEVGIALSILVSAVHAWRPLFAGREPLIACLFGLIHGLAFATVIGNFRLEPLAKAESILGFNLGIELVQLLVIACVLPTLLLLARTRAYATVRVSGAIFAGAAALAWIEERITGVPNGVGGWIDKALGEKLILAAILVLLPIAAQWRGKGLLPGRFRTSNEPGSCS